MKFFCFDLQITQYIATVSFDKKHQKDYFYLLLSKQLHKEGTFSMIKMKNSCFQFAWKEDGKRNLDLGVYFTVRIQTYAPSAKGLIYNQNLHFAISSNSGFKELQCLSAQNYFIAKECSYKTNDLPH